MTVHRKSIASCYYGPGSLGVASSGKRVCDGGDSREFRGTATTRRRGGRGGEYREYIVKQTGCFGVGGIRFINMVGADAY